MLLHYQNELIKIITILIFFLDSHLLFNFALKLLEICRSKNIENIEFKKMCCKCISIIGPLDLNTYFYKLKEKQNYKIKRYAKKAFIFSKFRGRFIS